MTKNHRICQDHNQCNVHSIDKSKQKQCVDDILFIVYMGQFIF